MQITPGTGYGFLCCKQTFGSIHFTTNSKEPFKSKKHLFRPQLQFACDHIFSNDDAEVNKSCNEVVWLSRIVISGKSRYCLVPFSHW